LRYWLRVSLRPMHRHPQNWTARRGLRCIPDEKRSPLLKQLSHGERSVTWHTFLTVIENKRARRSPHLLGTLGWAKQSGAAALERELVRVRSSPRQHGSLSSALLRGEFQRNLQSERVELVLFELAGNGRSRTELRKLCCFRS